MSRQLKRRPAKPPKQEPPKPLHLAANLPDDPAELFTQCSASWAGIEPLTVPGAVFENIVLGPAVIAAHLEAVGDALPPAEGGGTVPVATLRSAAETLRATWVLITAFCENALRKVPVADVPAILAQIHMTRSGTGLRRPPKPPIQAKQVGAGAVRIDVLALAAVVAYFYEYSVDQTNWSRGVETGRTDGTITGLKPGTLYYFRFRCLKTDDTYTDYSQTTHCFVQ